MTENVLNLEQNLMIEIIIYVLFFSMLVNGCISAKDLNNIIQDTKPSIKSMENRTNLKRPSSSGDSTYGTDSEEGSSIHEGGDNKVVRKRANLDHLSSDEKLMRRKLKNRVAAQNARDKKRVKMEDMEGDLERLKVSTFRSKHLHSKVRTVLIKAHTPYYGLWRFVCKVMQLST